MSGNKKQFSFSLSDLDSEKELKTDGCFNMPAAGNRNNGSTTMNNVGTNGNYWSATPNGTTNAYNLNFNSTNANTNNNNRNNGFTVRCVSALTHAVCSSSFVLDKNSLLADLIEAYYDARRHKRNTHNQLRFEMCMEEELVKLRDELYERKYRVGRSTCFIVEEPKKREIFAAGFRDRVVHHLLFNYVNPLFERTFIADSYSCRKKKGTWYGINRLAHHIRSCSDNYTHRCYVLKMDIKGYFMSINRIKLLSVCEAQLQKMACRCVYANGPRWSENIDIGFVLYLLKTIIENEPTEKCVVKSPMHCWNGLPLDKSLFYTPANCGLPIGNLTSQLFSNIYLNQLDQYVKRVLREKHYGRYVDDFFIVSRNKERLQMDLKEIQTFLKQELGLSLNHHKTELIRTDYGIGFLGAFVKPHRLYVHNRTKKRIFRAVHSMNRQVDTTYVWNRINSYQGHLGHFKCGAISRKLFTDLIICMAGL